MYIHYKGDVNEIISWLLENIPYNRRSVSGKNAIDEFNRVVYQLCSDDKTLYIQEEKYAELFLLRWSCN